MIQLSILNNSITWDNNLQKMISFDENTKDKISLLNLSDDKKTLLFKITQNLDDLDLLHIDGLATDKIERIDIGTEILTIFL